MLRVVIVGAGLGGLTCAVSCRQNGLDVVVLERAAQITSVSRLSNDYDIGRHASPDDKGSLSDFGEVGAKDLTNKLRVLQR